MRVHLFARDRKLRLENHAVLRFGDVERLAIGSAERDVRRAHAGARLDAKERLAEAAESPDRAEAGVDDREIAFVVEGHAVGSGGTARELDEDPALRNAFVIR